MPSVMVRRLVRFYELFERVIVIGLLVLLMVVVLWSAVMLGIALVQTITQRLVYGTLVEASPLGEMLSRMHMLHEVFGAFLLILIGLELMKTVVMYLSLHEMHVEVVFTVAMIAIARHAIDIDLRQVQGMEMLGMGALVVALSAGYYLFRKAAQFGPVPGESGPAGGD